MVRISVELPEEVAEALARAAAERQSTREAMLVEAARAFVAADDAFDAAVAEGEADLEAGREVPHEEVMQEMRDWAAELRRRHAGR